MPGAALEAGASAALRRTIVVGLGNPVLGDDAIGWRVVEALRERVDLTPVLRTATESGSLELDCLSLGGLRLMERLVGFDRAIVVDAIVTRDQPAGSLLWGELADDSTSRAPTHTGSAHDTTLDTALRLGRALGAPLPTEVLVLAIESGPSFEFSEELSSDVAAAVPGAVDLLASELRAMLGPAPIRPARNDGSIGTGVETGPPTGSRDQRRSASDRSPRGGTNG